MVSYRPTFIIKYRCLDKSGVQIAAGKMKVKNKATRFEAQCAFEDHLKKKYPNFGMLIVDYCQDELFAPLEEFINSLK